MKKVNKQCLLDTPQSKSQWKKNSFFTSYASRQADLSFYNYVSVESV